jgi:hypothetical protein
MRKAGPVPCPVCLQISCYKLCRDIAFTIASDIRPKCKNARGLLFRSFKEIKMHVTASIPLPKPLVEIYTDIAAIAKS